uniref:TAK19-1 n=1 Tax=Triticum aestivum TaxID=4565 RepID=Q9ATQ7_WHEAT|nr:TAK19-1 [Triticum aestivum]
MGNPGAFHHSITLQSFTVFFLLAVFVADYHVQGGDDGCSLFSCGHLRDISYPFRRRGDPRECGVEEYELGCTSSKATIHINTGTYYVTAIKYTGSYFWVMDPNFNTSTSCPLPLWNHLPYSGSGIIDSGEHGTTDSASPVFQYLATQSDYIACFANCSRAVTNSSAYKPVACLSAKNSHVYVWVSSYCAVEDLEPSCGYLGRIPFGNKDSPDWLQLQNASYADITQFISKGFTVQFPVGIYRATSVMLRKNINLCLNNSISYFKEQISGTSIVNWTHAIFWSEVHFLECMITGSSNDDYYYTAKLFLITATLVSAIAIPQFFFAKLYPRGDSFVPLSAMRGTVGYIAPEMISRSFGVISSKSDVYSFGMLLLEMAGGRRNADPNMGSSSQAYYPSWVYDQLTQEEAGEISPVAADMHELEKKLCVVGLWCIQMRSRDRPTMGEVIEILEAGADGLQMPSRPFFCDEGHIHVEDSYQFTSELTAVSEEEFSAVSEEDDV